MRRLLEVKPAQHVTLADGVILLGETRRQTQFGEALRLERLDE
jgi:hypothetical protein